MIRKVFLFFATWTLRAILRLRYKVEVKGMGVLTDKSLKDKGVVIYPSHPAEMDPIILFSVLGYKHPMHPLVIENFYYYPMAKPFMWLVGALPVAEFDKAVTDYKVQQTEKLYENIIDKLKRKEWMCLYPAGGLKRYGKELVGGRSMAHSIVKDSDAEILLVRMQGLWGSSFSTARTSGETPAFWSILGRGVLTLLKNGIFFAPRRKVTIEFSLAPKHFPKDGTKKEFNEALEKFYNKFTLPSGEVVEEEPLSLVREKFWSSKRPKPFLYVDEKENFGDFFVPGHIRKEILYQLSELSGRSVKDIHDTQDLIYDLGLDSMDVASIYSFVDSHYEIDPDIEPGDLRSVQDLFAAALHMKHGKPQTNLKQKGSSHWPPFKSRRPKPVIAEGKTLFEAFINSCKRMKGHAACADAMAGVLSYKKMLLGVLIMARKIEKMEGEYIGLLLPNLAVSNILMLAIMLSGKKAAPLNWTVGKRAINHAIDTLEIKNIITADRFLKKLSNVDLGNALEKLVLVEDIRKTITLKDKLAALFTSKKSTASILESYRAHTISENDVAVMIFTSGSTSLPKAVPLTHMNLLSNQRCSLKGVDLNLHDVMLMVLPLFHIFGMNMSLLPILLGVRVYFSPDPLDGNTIAREILKWRVSVIMMAPTFLAHLFRNASLSQLKSLRIIITGAEKAPKAIVDFINKLGGTHWIEGYGLTETAPIISVNQLYQPPKGVGRVIDCMKVKIRDPESGEIRPPFQIGEVCVTGDSVFGGYYKADNTDVFCDIDGERYFRTGDLGHMDEENHIFLTGRLKFSFKRGGEIISAVAIETELLTCAREKGWIKPDVQKNIFAIVPNESENGSTKVVLFSEIDLSIEQVNSALFEKGFARLYKVNEIIILDQIPMLKSGKTHYANLLDILNNRSMEKVK